MISSFMSEKVTFSQVNYKVTLSQVNNIALEPRLNYVSEKSYNDEMKKYSIRGKLFAIIGKNLNNRLAVFRW